MQVLYIIVGVTSFLVGVLITSIDYTHFGYIFVPCLVLMAILVIEINIRNKNIRALFIADIKSIKFELNQIEKVCGISILSLMVSPFFYMLLISTFGL